VLRSAYHHLICIHAVAVDVQVAAHLKLPPEMTFELPQTTTAMEEGLPAGNLDQPAAQVRFWLVLVSDKVSVDYMTTPVVDVRHQSWHC
jgi:hypothetical protein